jgi:hypothetical protein
MVEMSRRVECVYMLPQRWASQQLAKADCCEVLLLCCGRVVGNCSLGCWTAQDLKLSSELTLAALLGLKTTKSVKSGNRQPRTTAHGPRTRLGGTTASDRTLDRSPAVVLLTPRSMFQAPWPGGGQVGLGLLDSTPRPKCRHRDIGLAGAAAVGLGGSPCSSALSDPSRMP